jgi:hypothetical protein
VVARSSGRELQRSGRLSSGKLASGLLTEDGRTPHRTSAAWLSTDGSCHSSLFGELGLRRSRLSKGASAGRETIMDGVAAMRRSSIAGVDAVRRSSLAAGAGASAVIRRSSIAQNLGARSHGVASPGSPTAGSGPRRSPNTKAVSGALGFLPRSRGPFGFKSGSRMNKRDAAAAAMAFAGALAAQAEAQGSGMANPNDSTDACGSRVSFGGCGAGGGNGDGPSAYVSSREGGGGPSTINSSISRRFGVGLGAHSHAIDEAIQNINEAKLRESRSLAASGNLGIYGVDAGRPSSPTSQLKRAQKRGASPAKRATSPSKGALGGGVQSSTGSKMEVRKEVSRLPLLAAGRLPLARFCPHPS